ncbi:CHAT domain-containing protein [Mesorhizobium sp. M0579]|uniref:CHAT domain-containing protein n=1 Tax=Mesorhizobium sp. M0579 TaxID=2956962 RepID=UPI003338889F
MGQETTSKEENEASDLALEAFYRENGLGFGGGDILCIGGGTIAARVGQLILLLLSFHDKENRSPLSQIIVIAPPGSERKLRGLQAQLDEGIEKGELRPPASEHADHWFRFVELSNLRSESVIAEVRDVPEKSAIIVYNAAAFRNANVELEPDRPSLSEDFWVPQVHSLCSELIAATHEKNPYIVLDTGEFIPRRSANIEILKSLDDVGLLAGEMAGSMESILADRLDRWDQLIAEGRIGVVIRDIEVLDLRSEEKAFLRVQVFHRGGLHGQALEEIEKYPINDTGPFVLAKLARIASDAGATFLAAQFLRPSIEGLNNVEGLALALDTASKISEPDLEARAAARLEKLFPEHPVLIERAWRLLGRAGDYDGLAALAESQGNVRTRDLFKALSASLPKQGVPDYAAIEAGLSKSFEDQLQHINAILTRDARLRRLPMHALEIAIRRTIESPITARLVLSMVEELALDRDEKGEARVAAEQLKSPIARVIEYLARNTTDAHTRTRLVHVLSIDVTGTLGIALVATIALDFMRRPLDLIDDDTEEGLSIEELSAKLDALKPAFVWLSQQSPISLDRIVLPKEMLPVSADKLVPAIMRMIQHVSSRIQDDADINQIMMWVGLGIGINSYTAAQNHDLPMIRVAAGAFATAGRVQLARDMAEQALRAGEDTPARMRMSWFAVADIYQRLGNKLESLIAFACAAAGNTTLTGEEAWHETNGLVRLLRDLGMGAIARQVHAKGGEILERMGLTHANAHRHRFMSLSLDVAEVMRQSDDLKAKLPSLLDQSTQAAQEALDRFDAVDPAAILLGQLILWSRLANVDVPKLSLDAFDHLLAKASGPVAAMARTFSSSQPNAAEILNLHRSIESARYADDSGFDARFAAMAARRLLATQAAKGDGVVSTFAVEMLADRAIPLPGWQVTSKPLPPLQKIEDAADIARTLSREGISVVLLGVDAEHRLTRVDWVEGRESVTSEPDNVFSVTKFREWTDEFPFRYGIDEKTPNLFYITTEQLRVSAMPNGPVVIVADADLQQLPSNIIRINDDFAGQKGPLAQVPSLSWLKAARANPPKTNGRMVAWISQEERLGQTFVAIAGRLSETLDKHGIELDTGPEIPGNLAESELVIVTAHGGLGFDGRFFQRVSDEGSLVTTGRKLAASVRNVGVVVLFICSGGRADKVPDAVTTTGLAKAILDQGCSAVVASPWPLDSVVTYQWLPTFLDNWMAGKQLAEANFLANQHVAKALGAEPAKALAMHVYGDPLRIHPSR